MRGWRWKFVRAQVTGVLVSSYAWLVLIALTPPAVWLLTVLLAALAIVGWNTRPLLWVRFGVRRPTEYEKSTILQALVPMKSMRGRHQPRIWVGRWLGGNDAVMVTDHDLVIGVRLLRWVTHQQITDEQVCAIAAHAKGWSSVHHSRMVAAVAVYCVPWEPIQAVGDRASRWGGGWRALIRFAWQIRWLVLGIALVQAVIAAQWWIAAGVGAVGFLTWSTGHWRRSFNVCVAGMGDENVKAEGFGPVLAAMIRSNAAGDPARAAALELAAQQ